MNYPDTTLAPEGATFIAATEDMDLYFTGRDNEYMFVLPPEFEDVAYINISYPKERYPETSHKLYDICMLHNNIVVL